PPRRLPTGGRSLSNGRGAGRSGRARLALFVSHRKGVARMGDLALWAASAWTDMLVPGVSVLEKIIRPVIVYLALVIGLRIFGKRELAQLNPFDLVVLLSLSNTVQNAIIGDDNSVTGGLIGAFSLLTINYLVIRFLFKHRRLDQLLEGKPTVLIDN